MDDGNEHQDDVDGDVVRERIIGRTCDRCGEWVDYSGRGRPPRYCSKTCRNRASELRTAEARLGRELAAGEWRTEPVREVVERVIERRVETPANDVNGDFGDDMDMAVLADDAVMMPTTARAWGELLQRLTDDLAQPSRLRSRHFDHRHLYRALAAALAALDDAHPGGLDALDDRR